MLPVQDIEFVTFSPMWRLSVFTLQAMCLQTVLLQLHAFPLVCIPVVVSFLNITDVSYVKRGKQKHVRLSIA